MRRARGRRVLMITTGLAIVAIGGSCDARSTEVREVLVDYSHDEFPSSMIDFFPDVVRVHPGSVVRFRQAWTGEPHSVTFGSIFNAELGDIRKRLAHHQPPDSDDLVALRAIEPLPVMLGRDGDEFVVNQNAAQPCYLDRGSPPKDPDLPCPRRDQPTFTGRHSYYSSGFIPYTGVQSNTFEIRLADDIEPGTYNYYCNLHGVGQSGAIDVVPAREAVPSSRTVTRQAYARVQSLYAHPLEDALNDSEDDRLSIDGHRLPLPLAGVAADDTRPWGGLAHRGHFEHRHGSANEFVPKRLKAKTGEPVTWTFVGRHTISFNVPRYLPVFDVAEGGAVTFDSRVYEPIGWKHVPPPRPSTGGAVHADVGAWNGKGFRSTGLDWQTGDTFTLTFTEPGDYPYACLIHPAMIGRVDVDAA